MSNDANESSLLNHTHRQNVTVLSKPRYHQHITPIPEPENVCITLIVSPVVGKEPTYKMNAKVVHNRNRINTFEVFRARNHPLATPVPALLVR